MACLVHSSCKYEAFRNIARHTLTLNFHFKSEMPRFTAQGVPARRTPGVTPAAVQRVSRSHCLIMRQLPQQCCVGGGTTSHDLISDVVTNSDYQVQVEGVAPRPGWEF
jgi:hypothetical protein